MSLTNKLILALSILAVLDMIIPVPFTALLLIYVILEKPAWFERYVRSVYTKS